MCSHCHASCWEYKDEGHPAPTLQGVKYVVRVISRLLGGLNNCGLGMSYSSTNTEVILVSALWVWNQWKKQGVPMWNPGNCNGPPGVSLSLLDP